LPILVAKSLSSDRPGVRAGPPADGLERRQYCHLDFQTVTRFSFLIWLNSRKVAVQHPATARAVPVARN